MGEVNWSNASASQRVMLAERAVRGTGAFRACEAAADYVSGKANEIGKAWKDMGQSIWGPDEPQTEAGKASQKSLRANLRHNLEDVERIYEQPKQKNHGQQASIDIVQDSLALSPEALALMG
jgi:hypothetical protein